MSRWLSTEHETGCQLIESKVLLPERWDVVAYCREEVSRQGHNVESLDGIARIGWMLGGWALAILEELDGKPRLEDVKALGRQVEPRKNGDGFRRVNVYVGTKKCPDWQDVPALMERLISLDKLSPLEWYLEFERIHPFVDGNGRTGKILLNWLNGTLLSPQFPPSDLFGDPIRNP